MLTPEFKTPENGKHYYFGYYDKSPLNASADKMLALEVDFIDRLPEKGDSAVIGYFDLKTKQFVPLATTRTFNWQQGCMLQWLGPDHDSRIIFNDLIDGKFVSVILDVETKEKSVCSMAVYAVFPDGKGALCIDNERHHWCRRGYSYDGVYNQDKNKNIVEGDGIFSLDFASNKITKIIGIEDVNKIKPISTMADGANYVEHLMINPAGTRFAFLHRWKNHGGIYARLYSANMDGSDIYLLNDSGRMSHFCWRNDREILAWAGIANSINKLRKYKTIVKYFIRPLMPLYRMLARGDSVQGNTKISQMVSGDSYVLFSDRKKQVKRIAVEQLKKDGHPSFRPADPNIFITDTYPSKFLSCELIYFNMKSDSMVVLDQLKSIPEYDESPLRCDLHPKWSFCGNYVCVDTMNDGCRGMYLYDVSHVNT